MFKTSTREEESRKEKEGGIKVKRGFREIERTGEEEKEERRREDCRRGERKEKEKADWRREEWREK